MEKDEAILIELMTIFGFSVFLTLISQASWKIFLLILIGPMSWIAIDFIERPTQQKSSLTYYLIIIALTLTNISLILAPLWKRGASGNAIGIFGSLLWICCAMCIVFAGI